MGQQEEPEAEPESPEVDPEAVNALIEKAKGRVTPSEEKEEEEGHSHGHITPRISSPDVQYSPRSIAPPADTSGWLWKKAGGNAEGTPKSTSFSLTGRNWKKRWFTLKGPILSYYENASGPDGKFAPGQGTPLWQGDLKKAKTNNSGELLASLRFEPHKNRTVLMISFVDRLLKLGTAPGEQNQSDRVVLQYWHEAIIKHHQFATDKTPADPDMRRGTT